MCLVDGVVVLCYLDFVLEFVLGVFLFVFVYLDVDVVVGGVLWCGGN